MLSDRNPFLIRAFISGNDKGNVKMLKATFVLIAALGLAACETTEGFGRDVQKAGQAIEEEAD